jgi:transcriptional regulator with XRE-family HTH domain
LSWHLRLSKALQTAKEEGWTQEKLAKKLGIGQGTIANWKAGRREPSYEKLIEICSAISISPSYIMFGEQNITEQELRLVMSFRKQSNKVQEGIESILATDEPDDARKKVHDSRISMEEKERKII